MAATEQELKELLRKYYDGETSLEEEKLLQEIFQESFAGSQPGWAKEDQAQFLYFQRKQEEAAPASLSENLEQLIQAESTPLVKHGVMIWRVAAILVAVIGIGWVWTERYLNSTTTLVGAAQPARFILPDGSSIWLSEGSVLLYGRDFNDDRREVSLTGEGYFEVKHHETKPFMIHTASVTTEVLGTAFNLRAKPDEKTVELSVTEGRVTFGADTKTEVKAGQSATFDETTRRVSTDEANPNATAWKTNTLDFKNAKLRSVFRDLARYYQVKVKVTKRKLLNCRITAHFEDASLEEVLEVMSQTMDLKYAVEDGVYVVRGKVYCGD